MLRSITSTWRIRGNTSLTPAKYRIQWGISCLHRNYTSEASETTSASTDDDTSSDRQNGIPSSCQGVITTTSPSTTPLSALLPQLADYHSKTYSSALTRTSFLFLLLSPSYARHALDPQLALQAWRWLSGQTTLKHRLEVVTAVVDAIPGPQTGVGEGLAYLFRHPHVGMHIQSTGEAVDGDQNEKGFTSEPGTLDFSFRGVGTANVPVSIVPRKDPNAYNYTVSLPLAQTLFSTGKERTLRRATFGPTSETDHSPQLQRSKDLSDLSMRLPFTQAAARGQYGCEMSAEFPLEPLTPPRRVMKCMGNVIRSISAHRSFGRDRFKYDQASTDERDASQPASQELEEAISAFFAEHNIPPQPVEVYALIIGHTGEGFTLKDPVTQRFKASRVLLQYRRDKPILDPEWGPALVSQGIRDLLVRGHARLCKVLSGGGGWGSKRGLLSLDPNSYEPAQRPEDGNQTDGASTGSGNAIPNMEGIKTVIKPRENIMFFLAMAGLSPSPSVTAETNRSENSSPMSSETDESVNLRKDRLHEHAIFGVVPSTMDTLPTPAPPSDLSSSDPASAVADPAPENVLHTPNLFGAYSASPISLSVIDSYSTHLRTRLGAVGTRVTVEEFGASHVQKTKKVEQPKQEKPTRIKRFGGMAESDWYVGIGHETTKKVDLEKLREESEEAYEEQRDARTREELEALQKSGRLIDQQSRQLEDVLRIEDIFERMSDVAETEDESQDGDEIARPMGESDRDPVSDEGAGERKLSSAPSQPNGPEAEVEIGGESAQSTSISKDETGQTKAPQTPSQSNGLSTDKRPSNRAASQDLSGLRRRLHASARDDQRDRKTREE